DTTIEAIYGHYLCRGDQNTTSCHQCVATATTQRLPKECPNRKIAIIWYSNVSFFDKMDNSFPINYRSDNNITGNSTRFMEILRDMMNNVIATRAAQGGSLKKFATSIANYTTFQTIYGLGQCTPDLSSSDCNLCLTSSIEKFQESLGGRVIVPSWKVLAAIIVVVLLFLAAFVVVCICLRKKKARKVNVVTNPAIADQDFTVESLQYDLAALVNATDNFSVKNELGRGGFGIVYKGTLSNGKLIAVKRLAASSSQGIREFETEVLVVAKLQHRNLARLLGFCYTEQEKLLVYEYAANKSLDNFIFDFGISRIIFGVDQSLSNYTNKVVGTYGYMAPEYALKGQFSSKSDVYSFGVLVLEIISGKRIGNFYQSKDAKDLVDHAWKHWEAGTPIQFVDPTIRESCSDNLEVVRCIQLGLLCVQESVEDRPTMANTFLTLESYTVTLPIPKQPDFFAGARLVIGSSMEVSKYVPSSVNDISEITELEPRFKKYGEEERSKETVRSLVVGVVRGRGGGGVGGRQPGGAVDARRNGVGCGPSGGGVGFVDVVLFDVFFLRSSFFYLFVGLVVVVGGDEGCWRVGGGLRWLAVDHGGWQGRRRGARVWRRVVAVEVEEGGGRGVGGEGGCRGGGGWLWVFIWGSNVGSKESDGLERKTRTITLIPQVKQLEDERANIHDTSQ
ncbi:hypothetical protein KSS87_001395, partial [Heliosperma pusillum]